MNDVTSIDAATPIVRLESVRKTIGKRVVLSSISLRLAAGEVVGLWGPNGCGKTTSLRIVAGILQPDTPESVSRAAGLRIGYVPQDTQLGILPQFSVSTNLLKLSNGSLSRRGATLWLEEFGINKDVSRTYPMKLSGGFRQRLLWACATSKDKQLILLDEPFSSQDVHSTKRLVGLVRSVAAEERAVLIVVHNPVVMALCADRVIVLSTEEGKGASVLGELEINLKTRSFDNLVDSELETLVRELRQIMYSTTP